MFGLGKKKFTGIQIDHELVEEIEDIAKESYPIEFSAMLQGKLKKVF
jgi:hypothetical protein